MSTTEYFLSPTVRQLDSLVLQLWSKPVTTTNQIVKDTKYFHINHSKLEVCQSRWYYWCDSLQKKNSTSCLKAYDEFTWLGTCIEIKTEINQSFVFAKQHTGLHYSIRHKSFLQFHFFSFCKGQEHRSSFFF